MKAPTFFKGHPVLVAIALGALVCLAVCLPYLHTFGTALSTDPERWGQFGDYFGGILNPIVALMGFVGVIAALQVQIIQQRSEGRLQRLALLQNLIDSRVRQATNLLRQQWPDREGLVGSPYNDAAPLSKWLPTIAHAPRKVVKEHGHAHYEFADHRMRLAFNVFMMEIMDLAGELSSVAAALKKWKSSGGDDDLVWHLGHQFAMPIAYIHALGFSGSQALFEEVFPNIAATISSVANSIRVEVQ